MTNEEQITRIRQLIDGDLSEQERQRVLQKYSHEFLFGDQE